ncbi:MULTISPECIES: hypothetical protein [Streptomyces]|uniref:hypothetical protein n=1 Tax=Streptomyces TaxID=1883 RepID=UPI00367E7E40
MRHRTARAHRLPRRRANNRLGRLFLLGERFQILLEADRPKLENLLGIQQVRPHPIQSASSSSTRTAAAFHRVSRAARIDGIRHPHTDSISNESRLPPQPQSHA